MNEADTCRTYVSPKLKSAGWEDEHITEQMVLTPGRIVPIGDRHTRKEGLRPDYVLFIRQSIPIAVIEAKAEFAHPAKGLQQAMQYAEMLGVKFAYSSNGKGIVEHDFITGMERDLDNLPSPDELWGRLKGTFQFEDKKRESCEMARTKSKKHKGSSQSNRETSGKKLKTDENQNDSGSLILQNLMRDVKAKTGFTKTLVNPEGEISISDAVSKIIAPYRDMAQDYKSFHKLVTVACTAWNAAIMPVEKRESMLADMRKLMPDQQSREDFTVIVTDLMKRKNKLYPKVNRMIVQFKVTDRKNDFHIAIASTMENKETTE
jgi:hypothetical protein